MAKIGKKVYPAQGKLKDRVRRPSMSTVLVQATISLAFTKNIQRVQEIQTLLKVGIHIKFRHLQIHDGEEQIENPIFLEHMLGRKTSPTLWTLLA